MDPVAGVALAVPYDMVTKLVEDHNQLVARYGELMMEVASLRNKTNNNEEYISGFADWAKKVSVSVDKIGAQQAEDSLKIHQLQNKVDQLVNVQNLMQAQLVANGYLDESRQSFPARIGYIADPAEDEDDVPPTLKSEESMLEDDEEIDNDDSVVQIALAELTHDSHIPLAELWAAIDAASTA